MSQTPATETASGWGLIALLATVGVVLIAWGAVSIRRLEAYRTRLTIWEDALVHQPDDPIVHNNLGTLLFGLDRRDEAMRHFERADQLKSQAAEPPRTETREAPDLSPPTTHPSPPTP